ncbi:seryl-tRNA synthetase [Mycoplasma wenyonii str. Massachusetts]|uniref:Serine--tRNA ligase n=1 Tax=Mycoplasma wenyonii (strain Massachusetts) TaxID=1197325 RepID=I6YBR2_MYCWM|nr:serine--tRNA ligase [Mycoplasma wenyonii]AFN65456.1 seryl-tRNA synthetase [Mycoplasma wenyonii str. Massachusetts]
MLSLKWFREEFEELVKRYKGRENDLEKLQLIKELDSKLVELKQKIDQLRNQKNLLSKEGAIHKDSIIQLKTELNQLEQEYKTSKERFDSLYLTLPAIPDECVPESDQIISTWGEIESNKSWSSYLELAQELKLIEFKAAVSCSGSGFVIYSERGEKLLRALISFTLDWAESYGFKRKYLPVLINPESLICTSQLPKFSDTLFHLETVNKYLSPTAEVQLVNLFRDQILSEDSLPIKVCANTNCFRAEKVGAGVESKGLIRLYQFCKTEIVMLTKAEESEQAQEYLSTVIEELLKTLKLPYRKLLLSRAEMSFSSSKTFDFEVWMPSENIYREISSLSNTRDFQAIRGKIRYKQDILSTREKAKYVHILNGSCLAIDRLFATLIENYQTPDREIVIPEALVKYYGSGKIEKLTR